MRTRLALAALLAGIALVPLAFAQAQPDRETASYPAAARVTGLVTNSISAATSNSSAIDNACSTKSDQVVYVPNLNGPIYFNGLTPPANCLIIVDGWLLNIPGGTNPGVSLRGVGNVILQGHGILDGNWFGPDAAGSNYAVGDLITLDMANSSCEQPPILKVIGLTNNGRGTGVAQVDIATPPICRSISVGPFSQVSTTGNGSGATFELPLGTSSWGVYAYSSSQITIWGDLTIKNWAYSPVHMAGSSAMPGNHYYLSHLHLWNSGHSAGCQAHVDNCHADYLDIRGINDIGWAFYGQITNSDISNSSSTGNQAAGFESLCNSAQPNGSTNIRFLNDIATYNGNAGFVAAAQAGCQSTPGPIHFNIMWIGNQSYHNNLGGVANVGGFVVQGVSGGALIGNIAKYDGNGTNQTAGLWIENTSTGIVVSGNTFLDEGHGGTSGVGILISAPRAGIVPDLTIGPNVLGDDQNSATMKNGVSGTCGRSCRVELQTIFGTASKQDNLNYATGSTGPAEIQ